MGGLRGGAVENEGIPTFIALIVAATLLFSGLIAGAVLICAFMLLTA